jgi:hypothetical protein
MKCILYSLLVATLPFGSLLADAPKEKNAKVTLVYQHCGGPRAHWQSYLQGDGHHRLPLEWWRA